MKWKDARMHRPTCDHCDIYPVLVKLTDEIVTKGYATWMPTGNYTDGKWQDVTATNGNKWGDLQVLYWHGFLPAPEDVEL